MKGGSVTGKTIRIYHRYLGFFLAGIMAMYALSGIILIFRDTAFLKTDKLVEKKLEANLDTAALGKAIKINNLSIDSTSANLQHFKQGNYNKATGNVSYSVQSLPLVLEKMTKLHKANTKHPLFYLNIFFGASLLFFVLSSFWMFMPKTTIFKKGLYFTLAGILLTVLLLFIK